MKITNIKRIAPYNWKEEDIKAGLIVCKNVMSDCQDIGWEAKWTHKICWQTVGRKDKHYSLVAMSDGMIYRQRNIKELVEHLIETEMVPMPHSWFLRVAKYLKGMCTK